MSMTAQGRETLFLWAVRAIVLITAMPAHECAHALVAGALGDDTARRMGRITLNPLRHLDPWGSALLIFAGFGWARPVPVNARKFKHPRRDMALTAAAGPLSNILMAALLLIALKIISYRADIPSLRYLPVPALMMELVWVMLSVNLSLAVFNLLPIPPLDGSKFFGAIMPDSLYYAMLRYERYVMIGLFALMFTGVFTAPLRFLSGMLLKGLDAATRPIDLWLG